MNKELELVVCESCGRSYPRTEENRIYYGEDPFLKCPYCGLTSIGVVIKKEDEGVVEKDYDIDEEKWLEEHPEQGEEQGEQAVE